MLEFREITSEDYELLASYYQDCTYKLCEYSVGTKIMWKEYLHPQIAEYAGCLISINEINGKVEFDYPVAKEGGDISAALSAIEEYCRESEIRPILSVVPEHCGHELTFRWPRVEVINERGWKDYIYYADDFIRFEGRHYSGQRNHINKFRKNNPTAVFIELNEKNQDLIDDFFSCYDQEFSKEMETAKNELRYAKDTLRLIGTDLFRVGGLSIDGKLVSLACAEKCGETLIMHIEKALYSYEGVYPTTVQEFAKHFATDCRYINREDDARDKGLRTSKMQYRPCELAGKMCFKVGTELDMLREIPTLETANLTINALMDADARPYSELCLDDDRNKYWGYDYKKDLHEELTEDYFLRVAQKDWQRRLAVNFAIRIGNEFIGEVVLYNCDWRGGMELGCRILREYSGNQYGTEAFAAVAEWALYRLGLERVTAKCFKENTASYRMLSSCMNHAGDDEKFFYFEKRV